MATRCFLGLCGLLSCQAILNQDPKINDRENELTSVSWFLRISRGNVSRIGQLVTDVQALFFKPPLLSDPSPTVPEKGKLGVRLPLPLPSHVGQAHHGIDCSANYGITRGAIRALVDDIITDHFCAEGMPFLWRNKTSFAECTVIGATMRLSRNDLSL